MPEHRRPSPFEVAAAVADGASDVVAFWKGRPPIWFVPTARGVETLLGLTEAELATRTLADVVHADDVTRVVQAGDKLMARPGARLTIQYRARHREGHYVLLESTAVNRLDDGLLSAVVVHTRATATAGGAGSEPPATAQSDDRAAFLAALQESVALKQAKFWSQERFVQKLTRDRRYDFSVMRVALDRYGTLLGALGAEVVDPLVADLGARIRQALRRPDVLGYLGSGEFGILLRGEQSVEFVDRVSERVQSAVEEITRAGGHSVAVSATVGIVTSERPYETADEVMHDAAAAVARAKRERNKRRAIFATQMRAEDLQMLTMLGEIRTAIELEELVLYYQPIVDLASGAATGFEALVRWNHPKRGLLSPGVFLPVAEEAGIVDVVSDWVMHEACRQMAEWTAKHPAAATMSVSINLSPSEFGQGLRERIERTLRDTGLPPRQLRIEVTEHAVLGDREGATKALAMLQLYGVQVSLDDFGTGYASFGYLLDLPLDIIKIDRSFSVHAGRSDARGAIVQAVVNLAHTLGMKVVAEGIETAEQLAAVRALGTDGVQGYYYCRPVPAVEAEALIAAGGVM